MGTLFISDIHLSAVRPDITATFCRFLGEQATRADALYILGDLFEAWLGDDLIPPEYEPALQALRKLTAQNVPVYIMHGNRDFLLAKDFARQTGCELLPETTIVDLNSELTLLLHGDTLCTDDVEYQKFRQLVRDPHWQHDFISKAPDERIEMARRYRESSKTETAQKADDIMDVNSQAVEQAMQQAGVQRLIHGHTHRPAVHDFTINDKPAQRIVLADWYSHGSYLECDAQGCRSHDLQF